jgi:hypothetical protein
MRRARSGDRGAVREAGVMREMAEAATKAEE